MKADYTINFRQRANTCNCLKHGLIKLLYLAYFSVVSEENSCMFLLMSIRVLFDTQLDKLKKYHILSNLGAPKK